MIFISIPQQGEQKNKTSRASHPTREYHTTSSCQVKGMTIMKITGKTSARIKDIAADIAPSVQCCEECRIIHIKPHNQERNRANTKGTGGHIQQSPIIIHKINENGRSNSMAMQSEQHRENPAESGSASE